MKITVPSKVLRLNFYVPLDTLTRPETPLWKSGRGVPGVVDTHLCVICLGVREDINV